MFFNHSYLGDSSLTPALKFVKRARAKKRDERRFKYARVCSPIEISPDSIADMAAPSPRRGSVLATPQSAACSLPPETKKDFIGGIRFSISSAIISISPTLLGLMVLPFAPAVSA